MAVLQRLYFQPDTLITPIDIDDLHSLPPTPKPQILPSPVPSDPFGLHELQHALPVTEPCISRSPKACDIRQSEVLTFEEYSNKSPSIIQSGEELALSNKAHQVINWETHEEQETEIGERLDYRPSVLHDRFIDQGQQTGSEVILAPEQVHTHCQSTSSPTLPPTLSFDSDSQEHQNNGYSKLAFDHPINNGSQNSNKETHPPFPGGFLEAQDRARHENHFNDNESESTQQIDTINPVSTIQTDTSAIGNYPIQGPTSAEVTETVSCGQQSPGDRLKQQQKRKNATKSSIARKKRHKHDGKAITSRLQSSNQGQDLSSPFTALGSLSSFMETRGNAIKRQVTMQSPYFAGSENRLNSSQINHQEPVPDVTPETLIEAEKQDEEVSLTPTIAFHHIPQCLKDNQEPPILFLSTSLLKTHRRLVRILESMKHPSYPTLIYRDYDYKKEPPRTNTANKPNIHELQHETDIIISPSTGILLTTSQATTQLYLPGHKPSHPQLNGIKRLSINSPLRERIMLLAPRYEQLYIFICHAGGTTTKKHPVVPTADKRTLASITSLIAFCNSASKCSTITPLLIAPSAPEIVAEWILSLAYKHSFEVPQSSSMGMEMEMERSIIGFTPINPNKNNDKKKLDPACMETETQWELFLRRAGLNPFAAHVVLAVMREEGGGITGGNALAFDHTESVKVPALSRFIEMSAEHRRRLFAGLIGDRVLKRIEAVVDNDWQCDWALNFDAFR